MALTPSKPAADTEKKAAREAAQQDILLREVDEAVRQDEAAQFAKRYGRAILGLVVAGLLAFGGWLFWQEHREGQLEEGSEALLVMKTRAALVAKLFERVAQLHPYEVPELVALRPSQVAEAYGRWVLHETTEVNG